jgi:integrase
MTKKQLVLQRMNVVVEAFQKRCKTKRKILVQLDVHRMCGTAGTGKSSSAEAAALADITLPREGVKKEQRCFTDEEVGKILAAAPEPFGTILAVTSVLGLRIGEVLALRLSDVDFTKKIIRVRQSVDAVTR